MGQVPVAVTEVVRHVVSLILQGIEAFVFDFPAATTCAYHAFDIVPGDFQIGDPSAPIGHFALIIEQLVFQIVDPWGVVAVP